MAKRRRNINAKSPNNSSMSKRRRNINGKFHLPKDVIQHIQSLLSPKEAAQTSLLSKSWHTAWSTGPILYFDCENCPNKDQFWAFITKTMKRYEDFNLKVQSFTLIMKNRDDHSRVRHPIDSEWDEKDMKIAAELISKAMKMGTVDFNFAYNIWNKKCKFTLPLEVLESETLIGLSLLGCRIDLEGGKVNCLGLKSLSLEDVQITNSDILLNSCPLIEKLTLQKKFWGMIFYGPHNLVQLCNLRSLMLHRVLVNDSFFSDLSFKFPFLKDLSIDYCDGCREIKLCSHSLEYLSITKYKLRAHCKVPRIRIFKCKSVGLPSLYFKTDSREWKSDITVECTCASSGEFFHKLNTLLIRLRMSRITLSFYFSGIREKDNEFLQCLPKIPVENLKIYAPNTICCALMDCLFQICRPKFIAPDFLYNLNDKRWRHKYRNLVQTLGNKLAPAASEDCSLTKQNVSVVQDLEEVNVQLFEGSLAEWRPVSWKTFFDELSVSKNKKTFLDDLSKQTVRFQLRWRPRAFTFS